MSEPITGELRETVQRWGYRDTDGAVTFGNCTPPSIDAESVLAIFGCDFDRCCDAIDSVHAQLERENERQKEENEVFKRSAAHAYASGYEQGEQDGREGWVELPKDMDDKPIHFGDVMVMDGDSELHEVVGFYDVGFLAWRNGRYVPCPASLYRHHVPDTWESIIYDAMQAGRTDITLDVTPLIERCKALAGES